MRRLRVHPETLARGVALMAKGALIAHARDELGISEVTTARPVRAALTSAATFSIGAAMPLFMVVVTPASVLVPVVSAASLAFLALLGAIGARGAPVLHATTRITIWGALAMALTAPKATLELLLIALRIHHRTTYRYQLPVSLGPHRLILHPRETRDLRLISHEVAVTPAAEVARCLRQRRGDGNIPRDGRPSS